VVYLALTEVLQQPAGNPRVAAARRAIPRGSRVSLLLAGQRRDGGFRVHAYSKWAGGFWRLVALAEVAMPPGDRRVRALAGHVFTWLEATTRTGTSGSVEINGLVRAHATQEGYTLAAVSLLGLARLAPARRLVDRLIQWQWPDGGWNCDRRPDTRHSSFHETHGALWGLAEYHRATGSPEALHAAGMAAEFLLRHSLFRSDRTGNVIHNGWLPFRFPPYWHYDVLQGLWVLSRLGRLGDPRAAEALDLVLGKRRVDGMWGVGGYHWKPPGSRGSNVEVVDWGRRGPNEWVTLRALRVLRSAGRWP